MFSTLHCLFKRCSKEPRRKTPVKRSRSPYRTSSQSQNTTNYDFTSAYEGRKSSSSYSDTSSSSASESSSSCD